MLFYGVKPSTRTYDGVLGALAAAERWQVRPLPTHFTHPPTHPPTHPLPVPTTVCWVLWRLLNAGRSVPPTHPNPSSQQLIRTASSSSTQPTHPPTLLQKVFRMYLERMQKEGVRLSAITYGWAVRGAERAQNWGEVLSLFRALQADHYHPTASMCHAALKASLALNDLGK